MSGPSSWSALGELIRRQRELAGQPAQPQPAKVMAEVLAWGEVWRAEERHQAALAQPVRLVDGGERRPAVRVGVLPGEAHRAAGRGGGRVGGLAGRDLLRQRRFPF